jgi:hypothetical protein
MRRPKKGLLAILFMITAYVTFGNAGIVRSSQHAEIDVRKIIDRIDRIFRGNSSIGTMEMSVATSHWRRDMTLAIWSEGTDKVLVKVLAPKKEAGTATLKVGSDIWNYLPKIDRTIRIPTSMMMASWMGSHFTNDDLVKESRLVRDYDIKLSFEGVRSGQEVYEFTLNPMPQAPVVWGRIIMEVRKKDLMPLWARYYAEDGRLKRTLEFSQFREMGGRLLPSVMHMTPEDKPGEYTEMRYSDLKFDIPLPPDTFSLAALRK